MTTKEKSAALRTAHLLLREISFSRNPQLAAECIAIAFGVILGDEKETCARVAAKHTITRQAVYRRVFEYSSRFAHILK